MVNNIQTKLMLALQENWFIWEFINNFEETYGTNIWEQLTYQMIFSVFFLMDFSKFTKSETR